MPTARRARAIAAAVVLAVTLGGSLTSAESLQEQLQRAQAEMQKLEREAKSKQALLNQLQNRAYAAQLSYNKARNELEAARAELVRTEANLRAAAEALKQTEAELAEVEAELKVRQDTLASRMRSIYIDGRVEYLEVLFGSTSFSDFLSRYRLLQLVVKQDGELIDRVQATRAMVQMKKAEAERHRRQMEELRNAAQQRRDQIAAKVNEVSQRRKDLDRQQAEVRRSLDQLDRESKKMEGTIRQLEERIARELGKLVLSPPVKPPTRTSAFGNRWHPVLRTYRMHNGVDFAARTGQSVYAAADGTVIVATWQSGYGNVVVISHGKVNGKAISTLYAHNSKLKVYAGQRVKRGAVIALAGSTGMSTGPHVHFEVRVDGVPTDPMKWLSP